MLRMLKNLALVAMLAFASMATPGHADDSSSTVKVVQDFYDTLLSVMKEADKLGFQGRYAKLQPAIERT
jgi:hypothetical protein